MGLPTSAEWAAQIKQPFREQGYLRYVVKVVPPGLREGALIVASETHPITDADAIIDDATDAIEPIATFESGRWIGDGSQYLASSSPAENAAIDWWDNQVVHSDVEPSELTVTFDQPYSIPGIYGVWDTQTNSWPTVLRISGYDALDVLLDEYVITSITQSEQYIDAPFENCQSIIFSIEGWSQPNWRARVAEIMFGLYLEFKNNIAGAETTESVSFTGEELPVSRATLTVGNFYQEYDPLLVAGYSKYLLPKQRARSRWGFKLPSGVEHLSEQDKFIVETRIESDQSTFQITFGSQLDFLTEDFFQDTYTGASRTFETLAELVLDNVGLLTNFDGEIAYGLSTTLAGLSSTAPLPFDAANVILQLIAQATCTVLTTDPITGFIQLKDVDDPVRVPYSVTETPLLSNPGIVVNDVVRSIKVDVYTYTAAAQTSQAAKSELILSAASDIEIEYSGVFKTCSNAITNGTVNSVTYYARKAFLRVTPTNPALPVVVTISGYEVVQTKTTVQTYRNVLVEKGLDIIVENELVTNMATADAISAFLLDYHSKQQDVGFTYTGYPEVVGGDALSLTSKYGNAAGDVLEHTLTFNGGWHGTITAKMGGV